MMLSTLQKSFVHVLGEKQPKTQHPSNRSVSPSSDRLWGRVVSGWLGVPLFLPFPHILGELQSLSVPPLFHL